MFDTNGSGEAQSPPRPEGDHKERFPTNENLNRNGFPIVRIGLLTNSLEPNAHHLSPRAIGKSWTRTGPGASTRFTGAAGAWPRLSPTCCGFRG